MEFYSLIGVAVITAVIVGKKLLRRNDSPPPSPSVIKPFNPTRVPNGIKDPMDVELLNCTPLLPLLPLLPPSPQPTSPMSTSSDDYVMDTDYIK